MPILRMIQMRVNFWFNAKRAKSGSMGYASENLVHDDDDCYCEQCRLSFSSGTIIFSLWLYFSIYLPGSWPSDLIRLLQPHDKIPPTQESPVPIPRATSISNLRNGEILWKQRCCSWRKSQGNYRSNGRRSSCSLRFFSHQSKRNGTRWGGVRWKKEKKKNDR